MIIALPEQFQQVIAKNENLHRYLLNLQSNEPHTRRSWLYEDIKDADTILDMWLNKLSTLEKGTDFEREVFHFDTAQLSKWGPQGGHAPIDTLLPKVVLPTFHDASPHRVFDSGKWRACQKALVNVLHSAGLHGVRPASYSHVVDDMRARDTLESNSGWPDFKRRNLPGVKEAAIDAATDGYWNEYPAIALFRNYNQKTRLVWMFPMSANLVEGSFTQPLQSRLITSGGSFWSPWVGFEQVRRRITDLYQKGNILYASDFSATDEHFTYNTTLQVEAVLSNVVRVNARPLLHSTLQNMHYIPLIIGPDRMITGAHGVSSGSNWTNFIETLFDFIFSQYVSNEVGVSGVMAIGDDMLWSSQQFSEKFDTTLAALAETVGQEVNAEKVSCYQHKVKFLQRLFQRGYSRSDGLLRGVYSTVRALKSAVYPERFHKPKLWSSDMFCARTYMILENCVDHPLFDEFVKFVVQGQKDLIPFARKSRAELDQILRKTKLLPGFNPTYNQERRDSSLANFESIRIARNF